MTRQEATQALRDELNKHGLNDWSIRLNQNPESRFLGLCSHKDKTIILSVHHIDIHPSPDVINTIKHEVAHALVGPWEGHNNIWVEKAREIGCDNTMPCSTLSLSPHIIDAIRSGADVEVTFEEQIVRTPKYTVTRLQDKCEYCGKVAKTEHEWVITPPIIQGKPWIEWKMFRLECGHLIVRKIPKGTPFHTFQFGGSETCEHVWSKNSCLLCNRKRPYQFQLDGMAFGEAALAVNHGVAFFDDMGLGKTIQAQGVVYFNPQLSPTLWIVKSGLKYQFAVSIMNWMGDEHLPQIIESSNEWLIPGWKNYIIGYDMLVQKSRTLKSGKVASSGFDIKQFERVGIKCVVLDECQQIKNVDSSRTQMVRRVVKGRKVIALSGTPWKNRGSELFPVLNMLDPMKFHSEERFKHDWVDYFWQGQFRKEGGIKRIPQFKQLIKDLCIRRERTEVMSELPLVNRTKLYVKMDINQERAYDAAVEEFVQWYEQQNASISGMAIIAAMQKMRHLVALAKIPATLEYVDEFVENTELKLVVFAHHKDVQALLYDELNTTHGKDIPILKLTSEMDGASRFETQELFNRSPRAIMVASMLAAGEGLNLQTCSSCIMHERQWNPANEEQCEGRFIRIGQTSTSVDAVYTHMEGLTVIDTSLDNIVEGKRIRFHNLMNNTEMTGWSQDSIMKELAESIARAHRAKRK
jgi:hypothetical protein